MLGDVVGARRRLLKFFVRAANHHVCAVGSLDARPRDGVGLDELSASRTRRKPFDPPGKLLHAAMLYAREIVVDRIEQKVGDEVGIGSHVQRRQILNRVVPHHQDVFARQTGCRKVFRIVGEMRFDA